MSLGSLLSIARSALTVSQRAMEVTGQNIANANTPGYSRQILEITAATPLQMPTYSLGRGVEADQITRARSSFYDATYREDNGLLGNSNTLNSYLGQVEGAMNEPSTTGISAALDNLFGSLSDLAGDPSNPTNRQQVVATGTRLVNQLHSLNTQLGTIRQDAVSDMTAQVSEVNSLAGQIAQLNNQVVASGGLNGSPDLMDARDNLVDQLSQYVDVTVTQRPDGSYAVAAGDTMLVDGANATQLAVGTVGAGWGVVPAGGGAPITVGSGSLQALADLTQTKLPGVQTQLDQFSQALVTQFNQIHEQGTTLNGATGVDFFDPAGTTAGSIQLSAAVLASPDNIAASATGAQGNGDIATQLANLATTGVAALGGSTLRDFYTGIASGVGTDVSNAQQDVDAQQTLVDNADAQRQSVSGVSTDEEMVALIGEQQAYQAAAHLVTVANTMMDDLMTAMTS